MGNEMDVLLDVVGETNVRKDEIVGQNQERKGRGVLLQLRPRMT